MDTGCLLATQNTVKTSVTKAGTLKSAFLGQEGFFLVNCTGPGRVWIQSMPFSREVSIITAEQSRQQSLRSGPTGASPK
jgi:uncharacterized protein (AIM24 family)